MPHYDHGYADAMHNQKILGYFEKMKIKCRLVYCFFSRQYLLNTKDTNSAAWDEKYISKDLGVFIRNNYAK